jgi:hypothetical protein
MVQIIENTGGFGTRLGAALGKGLGEAIPRYVERQQLSKGLQSLGNVSMDRPLDAIAQMMNIPGMTLEKAQVLFPFLQQQMQRQEAMQRGGAQGSQATQGQPMQGKSQAALQPNQAGQSQQASAVPTIQGLEAQPTAGEPLPQQGLLTPEDTQILQQTFQPPSYNDKLAQASQLMQQFPGSFPTMEAAMAEVDRGVAANQAQFQAAQGAAQNKSALQASGEAEFKKQLGEKIQADINGLGYGQVWGDLQGDLQAQMFNDIRNGADVKTAAAKYAKIGKEMAETITKLNEFGSWGAGKTPTEAQNYIKNAQAKFDKLGKRKEFAEILQKTQGIPAAYAHHLAYPLQENKGQMELLKGLKDAGLTSVSRGRSIKPQEYERIADDFMKNLQRKDSALSFALALREKGYDESKFLDILREKYKDDLSSRQYDDIAGVRKINPNLNANWLFAFSKIPLGG